MYNETTNMEKRKKIYLKYTHIDSIFEKQKICPNRTKSLLIGN